MKSIVIFASFIIFVAAGCDGPECGIPAFLVPECPFPPPEPADDWSNYFSSNISEFILDDGSKPALQNTAVYMCTDDEYFYVKYDCVDNNIYSPFTEWRIPLFKNDVVEMFISAGSGDPHVYLELEFSPNSVLFASRIFNPNMTCGGIQENYQDCNSTGIEWQAERFDSENYWWAYAKIPWSFINVNQTSSSTESMQPTIRQDTYRANFFRVDTPSGKSTEYSCWSPTWSKTPCFHKPRYFGILTFNTSSEQAILDQH